MIYFTNTLAPLIFGITIYIFFRTKATHFINEYFFPNIYFLIGTIQEACRPLKLHLPPWFLYSLPDGLWTYSMTSMFIIRLRDKNKDLKKLFYFIFCPFLSISFEVSQALYPHLGTFDIVDLNFVITGSILPFLILRKNIFGFDSSLQLPAQSP